MAFKIDKKQQAERAEIVNELRANAEDVKRTVAAYNETVARMKTYVDGIAEEKRGDFDDKSEKWQEGDAGQSAEEFVSAWEEFDTDAADTPELDHADRLENLPHESE